MRRLYQSVRQGSYSLTVKLAIMSNNVNTLDRIAKDHHLAEMLRCNRESYKNLELKTRELQEELNRLEQRLWSRQSAR